MVTDRRFGSGFGSTPTTEPGLVLEDDDVVYIVKPDGTREVVGGGGSLPPQWSASPEGFATIAPDSDPGVAGLAALRVTAPAGFYNDAPDTPAIFQANEVGEATEFRVDSNGDAWIIEDTAAHGAYGALHIQGTNGTADRSQLTGGRLEISTETQTGGTTIFVSKSGAESAVIMSLGSEGGLSLGATPSFAGADGLLSIRNPSGDLVVQISDDGKVGFFERAPAAQQTLPAADPVLLGDVITLAEDIRALLVAYGLATLV